jgi:tryptophanyl-tRNA synthetase
MRELTNRDLSTYGFLGYPVLQAADILIYKADAVPVGEDQVPHLELTRQIARKFNHLYKKGLFPEPQALLTVSKRLLGLDGRKMSKSYNNFISLSEGPEGIRKKVYNMFTDPSRIKFSDPGHPEKCNVHSYYGVFAPERKREIDGLCRKAKIGCTDCKKELAEILIKFLSPIREKRGALLKDKNKILDILREGEKKAQGFASSTMAEVKSLLNL